MKTGLPTRGVRFTGIVLPAAAAGRSIDDLELVGGLRPTFPDDRSPRISTSQYTDTLDDVPALCRRAIERLAAVP